ncbi:endoribonuclease LACTB2 [Lingula anatina]|uniref:Endoribonuclease LACTB2 n=1 Tax=Lingula anatina TaxID=7574 RepID=A0A1S3I8Z0_LINAN|nr:endoribonuclease LACTB2 [Lingula anatina]|eukprot:XP_013393854.1 endoribonuclease LACTB2 [Lingula anatina]
MASILPRVEQLSSRVVRLLGCNPGPMTLQGTNSYLIGTGERRILLDTSNPNHPEYLQNLKTVLRDQKTGIQEILLTHWHLDHVGAVPEICQDLTDSSDMPISKYQRISTEDAPLGDGLKYSFIEDGKVFKTEGGTLRAVYTPGHTDDHLSFYLEEENALFSGDCILGQGTAVFEDFYTYMKSLELMLKMKPTIIYPGHGPVITNPVEKINEYIAHRMLREQQILEVFEKHKGVFMSCMDLVKIIYTETPEHLHHKAADNVCHHLEKLLKENRVEHGVEEEGRNMWRLKCSL